MENKAFDSDSSANNNQVASETGFPEAESGSPHANRSQEKVSPRRADAPYAGMGKDDLLRFSQTKFWKRLRLMCMVIFWSAWLGLFTAVIVLTVVLPRCKQAPVQAWWKTSNFYQIYVRSFHDNNADGVGDLQGVRSKLDYLQSIHADTLLLSSFYEGQSGERDFGYEIINHTAIDPVYGTMEDFRQLLMEAHDMGMKVILDFVPNYTGREHPWFIESKMNGNLSNPYWNYYMWYQCTDDEVPTNWLNVYGDVAWTRESSRGDCYLHQFTAAQPELNLRSPAVRQELESIIRFWLIQGVDGFRVNVPAFMFESPDFPDEDHIPGCTDQNGYNCLDHTETRNLPEVYDMIHRWREILDEYAEDGIRVLLTDSHESMNITANYYGLFGARGAQLPVNYGLRQLSIDCGGDCVNRLVSDWLAFVDDSRTSTWAMSSQDLSRLETDQDDSRSSLILLLAYTLPGVPMIYYGQEIAMTNGRIRGRNSSDPTGDRQPAFSRDQYRTPMQWSNETFAGFMNTSMWQEHGQLSEPWLPVNEDYQDSNVQSQEGDKDSRLNLFRSLSALRQQEPAIRFGDYYPAITNTNMFSFIREFNGAHSFLVAINFGKENSTTNFGALSQIPDKAVVHFSTTHKFGVGDTVNLQSIQLLPNEGVIFSWEYRR